MPLVSFLSRRELAIGGLEITCDGIFSSLLLSLDFNSGCDRVISEKFATSFLFKFLELL